MSPKSVVTITALTLLAAGCTDRPRGPKKEEQVTPAEQPMAAEKPAEAAEATPAAAKPATPAENPMRLNGVSEEDFKKLHALNGEAAPALHGAMVDVGGGKAYLSLPEGVSAPLPAVLVIHEWWGLNDHIKHYADRLAGEGYAALAVDLYGGKVASTPDEAMKAMQQVDPTQATAMLEAAAAFLQEDSRIKAEKRGVIGWCFGGAWSLQTGLEVEGLDAVVMYYGRVETDPAALEGLDAPLLGIFANQDDHITPEQVDKFEAALKEAGKPATIVRYDAKHAFANPSNPVYDQEDAADAWQKARSFLARNLQPEK